MDLKNFSGAGKGIPNWTQNIVQIREKIGHGKSAFSDLSTKVKNAAILGGRNPIKATSIKSLTSLLPPAATERLNDARETTQKFIVRGFAKALKNTIQQIIPKEKKISSDRSGNYQLEKALRGSSNIASDEEVNKFKESCNEGGMIAIHLRSSLADVTKETGIASKVREGYKQCQENAKNVQPDNGELSSKNERQEIKNQQINTGVQNDQSKSSQLEKHLGSLNEEDAKKYLSLKTEELEALQIYTAEGDYRLINHVLDGDLHNLETWQTNKLKYRDDEEYLDGAKCATEQVITLTASAINKLPQHKETVYKSVRMESTEVEKYKKAGETGTKEIMMSKKFLSTTKNLEQAESFDKMQINTGLTKVIYQIEPPRGKALNGADITCLSAKEGEEEVLLNYGLTFVFTGFEDVRAETDENGAPHEAYVILKFQQEPFGPTRGNSNA